MKQICNKSIDDFSGIVVAGCKRWYNHSRKEKRISPEVEDDEKKR